jgi:predicted Zn-dependent protease
MMQGTVGASASTQLAFSRANETDADQAGMKTLVNAGFSASAMPRMFTRLQDVHRFAGSEAPEFLRTHPVTQNRIADSSNRALSMPQPSVYSDSTEFLISRARVFAHLADQSRLLEGSNQPLNAYLLAVKAQQSERAEEIWQTLNSALQQSPWLQLSRVEQLALNQQEAAERLKEELLELYPDDYAIQRARVDWLTNSGRAADAIWTLRGLVRDFPDNPQLWYQLAELYGATADRNGIHRARIEYFLLRGDYDLALRQLDFARRDARSQPDQLEWITQREQEVLALRDEVDALFK